MQELNRGLSFVVYRYEGGPLRFAVPFPSLKKEHVHVLVGDPQSPRTLVPSWVDSTTVEIPEQDALAVPFTVQVQRRTPVHQAAIDFKDGPLLPAKHLNTAVRQLLYIQQELREFGLDGSGLPNDGIPGGGSGIPDIQTIIDNVMRSPAMQQLLERIPLIDLNAETLLEGILREHGLNDIARDYGDRISSAYEALELVEEDGVIVSRKIVDLFARMTTLEGDAAANYTELFEAIATETAARVLALQALHAQFTSELGDVNAALIQRIDQAYADAEQAWAAADLLLAAQINDAFALYSQQIEVLVNDLGSRVGIVETAVAAQGGTIAALQNEVTLRVTVSEAEAIASQQLQVFSNGTFAALREDFETYVDGNDGRWESTWSIRINGGDPANPVVSGISLGANQDGSAFIVQADTFGFTLPPAPGVPVNPADIKYPFVIGVVGGVSTVGITGQLLVDGSITANKITANSLSAITANAGTLNGGTFKTHTLNASGEVTNPLEFRAEMSNVGEWPLWVGSGAKTVNNAVFWVDRLGAAGFAGKVSAPNIVGQFQAAVAVNWGGSFPLTAAANATPGVTTRSEYTTITSFTLPAPLEVGSTHRPSISLTVTASADIPGFDIVLERLNASVWEVVTEETASSAITIKADNTYGTGGGYAVLPSVRRTATLSASSAPVGSAQQFRVRARYARVHFNVNSTAEGYPAFIPSITSVTGFAFGIR